MPVEATDVDQPFDISTANEQDAPASEPQDAPQNAPQDAPEPQDAPQEAPQKRGRPAGAKDKQPRKRPVRAASPERPVTRRSAPPRKVARRVQIVESASEASSSAEEDVETPRTARHRQWAEYRQQKSDAHQMSVNRYAALFDRMLA